MTIIVSLTTIPERLPFLQSVIDSLHNQTVIADRIELYIPREYSKRSLGTIDPNLIPSGVQLNRVDIDYGPATKVLPACKKYKNQPDTKIIYCDDDIIHDKNWIKRLVEASDIHPESCITERGWNVKSRANKLFWLRHRYIYKLLRLLTFGIFKSGRSGDGSVSVAEGCGGVLVKPYFFDDDAFEIPELFWMVDDVWLSGCLTKRGHTIKTTLKDSNEGGEELILDGESIASINSLLKLSVSGYDRRSADENCIKFMQKKFKIWS